MWYGRIEPEKKIGVVSVREVGRIDIEKYRCVAEEIITDEVVITDERIAHIREHHPNDYERFSGYLSLIISEPDYIIEDVRPNTAVVLKEIVENKERFRLALRLVTPGDHPKYKNFYYHIYEDSWKRMEPTDKE